MIIIIENQLEKIKKFLPEFKKNTELLEMILQSKHLKILLYIYKNYH